MMRRRPADPAAALDAAAWPRARLADALAALARRCGATPPGGGGGEPPIVTSGDDLNYLITRMAHAVGLEAEPAMLPYNELDEALRAGVPWLLALDGDGSQLAVVVGARRAQLQLLGPDQQLHRVPLATVRARISVAAEAPFSARLEAMLDEIEVAPRRRERARRSLLRQWLRAGAVDGCWFVRLPPSATLATRGRERRLVTKLAVATSAHVAEYGLGLFALTLLAQSFLRGRADPGLLAAAGLILLFAALFGVLAYVSVGQLAIDFGVLLKQRLLAGTLALPAGEVRSAGAGQLLGRVIESDAVETLALGGGAALLFSTIELLFAVGVLFAAPVGRLAGGLLLGWLCLAVQLGRRYLRRRAGWTERRLTLTNDLVELILGHRTRLAQEPPERRHQSEDRLLGGYVEAGRAVDWAQATLTTVLPRGWLIVGLLAIAPLILGGKATLDQALLGLSGIVIAYRALRSLVVGFVSGAGALIGWRQVATVYRAAGTPSPAPRLLLPPASAAVESQPLVELEHLSFIYPSRSNAVLRDVSLQIATGERILLEGESGSGKSTLASLLSGLQRPQHGTLWLKGLDWQTIGADEWRRHVVFAPQFQENHVLTGSLAFNLLMGRNWPASAPERDEALELCYALGLGDLVQRMPAGLDEVVGETGWQLSHGEKSRLYIARALLQGADLVLLDESFAALDPETLHACLTCVLERAKTLVVVAHP